ncbi:MAG: Arc family DNA-binding protein [Acidovorax sp.]
MTLGRGSPAAQGRLPDDLKAWLQHEAIDNRRSLNSEILVRLEQSRAQQLAQHPQGAQV